MVPGRFKDYVSTPKQNDYRSIHTTVIGPSQQRVELQIRTKEMHQIADYGIAAHALYKDDVDSPTELLSRESSAYAWLRRTIELLAEGSNPEEFLEHTKLELFHDQVFCFTPKGKLIALPRHANLIDFAYAVHTDVGNMAVGGKINGKIAPLVSELTNGDEVEVITSRAQHAPPAAWESLVITGKARAAVRRATRVAVRNQYAGLGRRIVERLCQRAKMAYSDEKLRARCRGWRAFRSRMCCRRSGVARCAQPMSLAPCIPTTRKSARHDRAAAEVGERLVRAQAREVGEGDGSGRVGRGDSDRAASTPICRCGSPPTAARCRATASSAS